jgi:hypothetical protein
MRNRNSRAKLTSVHDGRIYIYIYALSKIPYFISLIKIKSVITNQVIQLSWKSKAEYAGLQKLKELEQSNCYVGTKGKTSVTEMTGQTI